MISTIQLPMPPSINDYYSITKNRQGTPIVYIKPKGKWYRQQVYFTTCTKFKKVDNPFWVNRLYIYIKFYPRNLIRDIDNPLKCLFDSITHAHIWKDDRYVRKCFLDFADKPSSRNYLELSICNDFEEYKEFIINKISADTDIESEALPAESPKRRIISYKIKPMEFK